MNTLHLEQASPKSWMVIYYHILIYFKLTTLLDKIRVETWY